MSDFPSQEPVREVESNRKNVESGWIVGGVLILIGVVMLFQNLTGWSLQNWWALFILIPAVGSFNEAYRGYRADGRLSRPVRGKLLGGFILTLISFAFLFNIGFGTLWPLALIGAGLALLLNGMLGD